MRSGYSRAISIIRKRPTFDNCPGAIVIALGYAGGAVFGVLGVGVHDSVLDAAV